MPINTAPPSVGERSGNLGRGRRLRFIRQRVSIANDASAARLSLTLPGKSQFVWAVVRNQTAVAVDGNDATSTADCFGLFNLGTSTAFGTATASNATASALLTVASAATSMASSAVVRGTGVAAAAMLNTTTSEINLALVPMATSSNRIYPKSDGFLFNGTAEVDVVVYYEQFDDTGA